MSSRRHFPVIANKLAKLAKPVMGGAGGGGGGASTHNATGESARMCRRLADSLGPQRSMPCSVLVRVH